ncbi:MAG TPA: adenylate/guanylate cyclase domain-containing protein [Gaiellaceae bacterium]|nr:adenylate/guanylate cyclase domain-containing protein [Gaiellaceae bacterium]
MATPCPACGAEQAADARFCSTCGEPQFRPCPNCGAEQPVSAAFCSSCGNALQGEGEGRTGLDAEQERRVVTVLFADLAGSTALGEQLDPEDVRDVQASLFELLNAQVERFGGTTEKFVGDAILAVFGIPQAHEDDPERAVRAGLAAREQFSAFAEELERRYGAAVGLRIGVNTGEVVSSREAAARGELMVSGDAVNVAARLQQSASRGEILVGQRTHAATSRSVAYGARRELDAKGKSAPVFAWDVQAVEVEPAIRASASSAPLIGREEELTVLEAVAARTRREQLPQLVTLFGPAGVGKSRLVEELLGRFPDARVLKGRCLPYGEGITYWPLAEATKADAGILDTDPAEVALAKLSAAVGAVVGDGAEEVVETIAWTIGLTGPGSPFSEADPDAIGERLAAGWQRYVGALGAAGLTVLVIEDVHWASEALLELVEQLASLVPEGCVLLVCTARPEFLTQRPTWGAGSQNATALSLAPLSAEESELLVSLLLGEAHVPEDVRRPLLSSAEGNPFFLEEMLQMLIDEGAIERRNGGWAATGRLAELAIPDSVHGVIAARLDLLEPEARAALRRCAVVGRVFWPSAVAVEEELVAGLTATGLVSAHPLSVMAGLREFSFKHALTRDVAYSSLARPERRDLHRRVAEWIQSVAPGRDVETAELVGYHYLEAIGYGENDPAVARRAFDVLLVAGRAATRRGAFGAAREQLGRALELADDDDRRTEALVGLVEIESTGARWALATEYLDAADELVDVDARRRADVLSWRSRVNWLTGEWEDALAAAQGALTALTGLPESPQLARALARRSQLEMLGNRPESLEHSREALKVAERVGDDFAAVNAKINIFAVEATRAGVAPDPDDVLAITERAVAIGAHEEAMRAVVNFIWSGSGYVHVDRIEAVAAAGREGRLVPASIGSYLDLSLGWMLHAPAGRWSDADALLARIDERVLIATASLLWLPLSGVLALRRGDLKTAQERLDGLWALSLASGESQRTVPSASVVFPWLGILGRTEELREAARALLESVQNRWPVVQTSNGILRTLARADERELLEATVDSMRRSSGSDAARLGVSVEVGEALLALANGRADEAAERLRAAVAREEELGFAYDAACLRLELARALAAVGAVEDEAQMRSEAERLFASLACVHPV